MKNSTKKQPKKRKKVYIFKDYPEFQPNISPGEMFRAGVFGGTYWRPIYSKITNKKYKNQHKEFPVKWWKGLDESWITSPKCDKTINKFGVTSGTSLRYWEERGWMHKQDPYGWVQWYCRFWMGRRTSDDKRQIDRWLGIAGPNGRFKKRLDNMKKDGKTSPKIQQLLLQWALLIND